MKITIISPDMIRLDKKLNRLKKEIPTKLSTAMKIVETQEEIASERILEKDFQEL